MSEGAKTYWKMPPIMVASFILVLAALSYASWESLVRMEYLWETRKEYGYAYIIPFITAYFIWQDSVKIKNVEFSLNAWGAVGILFGCFLITLGVLSATHSITQYGYVLAIVSTVLFFIGWPAFKIIMGPLLLLFLAVPLPNFLLNNLSSQLQLLSSQIGVAIIRAFGISVYLEGNVIDLGKFQLQVVEACSGLRYLFPLISLSIIAAFMYQAAFWKRMVVVLSSLPITVFMNSFRIGVIGILVEYYGIEQAEGFLHDFEGWFVFMLCVGVLMVEMWLLVAFGKNRQKLSEVFAVEAPGSIPEDAEIKTRPVSRAYIAASVVVLVLGVLIGSLNGRSEIIPERKDFTSYPLEIGDWVGQRGSIKKKFLDALKLNDYIIADYTNSRHEVVNFYMAYYESQRSGAAAHSPRSCIPGGGWRIKSHKVIKIDVGGNKLIQVNRLLIKKGDYGQLVYYWFDQRGRDITNEYLVKWYLFLDSMTKGRTDGALVRLTTPIAPGDDLSDADDRLVRFLKLVAPTLPEYIPE